MGMTREELLAMRSGVKVIAVPINGTSSAFVRTPTAADACWYGEQISKDLSDKTASDASAMARLVAITACDEQGRLLFGRDDVDAIRELPITAVKPLFDAAQTAMGWGEKIEETAKN